MNNLSRRTIVAIAALLLSCAFLHAQKINVKGVVLDEDLCGEFSVFTENRCCEAYRKIHFEKTGRHLDGVEKLLEEMRSDS